MSIAQTQVLFKAVTTFVHVVEIELSSTRT